MTRSILPAVEQNLRLAASYRNDRHNPADHPARPDVSLERDPDDQPALFPGPGRPRPVPIYRGYSIPLTGEHGSDPALNQLRVRWHGNAGPHAGGDLFIQPPGDFGEWAVQHGIDPQSDDPTHHRTHDRYFQQGVPHFRRMRELDPTGGTQPYVHGMGREVLDYLRGDPGRGLGSHWTIDPEIARGFAQRGMDYVHSPSRLPVVVSGLWHHLGEDPDRTGAGEGWGSESELTMLHGAPIDVTGVHVPDPTNRNIWTQVLTGGPRRARARLAVDLADPDLDDDDLDEAFEDFLRNNPVPDDMDGGYDPYDDAAPHARFDDTRVDRPTVVVRGRPQRYFSPRDVNPVPQSLDEMGEPLRPPIEWRRRDDDPREPPLGLEHAEDLRPLHPRALYRGVGIDLDHPDLRDVRAALHGHDDFLDVVSPPLPGTDLPAGARRLDLSLPAHRRRFIDTHLPAIVRHLQDNERHYGLGTHWTVDPDKAAQFAQAERADYKLPVVLSTPWHGVGEDPYRNDTGGKWTSEREVTMLPGARTPISRLSIDPSRREDPEPGLGGYRSFLHFAPDAPLDATARRRL